MVKSLARRRQLAREKWQRQQRRRHAQRRRSRRRTIVTGVVLAGLVVVGVGVWLTIALWPDSSDGAGQNNGLDIVENVTEAGSTPGLSTAGSSDFTTTVAVTDVVIAR